MKSLQIVFGLLLAAGAMTAQQYTISTVAGIPTVQSYFGDGGPATGAGLDYPLRVALDLKGNLYIADFYTYVVRQVSASSGNITTFAGDSVYGFAGDGGPAYQGELSHIHGLAADPSGTIYIADSGNSRIRAVNSAGNIYTFAGNGTVAWTGDGGAAVNAGLVSPTGVVSDPTGNIYIADYGSSTVRKVDTKGTITTLAGNGSWGYSGDGGPANKAMLAQPTALAADAAGNIYIGDPGNTNIRKVTTDGNIHTIVSNVDAESIAVDAAGSIYYPNYVSSTVQKILSSGTQFTIAGTGIAGSFGDGGPATSAQLNSPYGVALDSAGNVYVADYNNMAVRKLTPAPASIGVVSAASGVGLAVAPGEVVAIYGTGLGPAAPASQQVMNGAFGTQLAGTTVSFDGVNAPILYTSAAQINVIVPYATSASSMATVVVNYQGQQTATVNIPIVPAAPGIFTMTGTGTGQAAAVNQDGTINSLTNPARQGSYIMFYLTGEGVTSPAGNDGQLTPLPPAPARIPVQPVLAYLSGQQISVPFAGEAPGEVAGVMQVNVQIPANLLPISATGATAVPLQILVGSSFIQTGVTIAVAP